MLAEAHGDFPKVTPAQMVASIETAIAADPEAAATVLDPTFSDATLGNQLKVAWKACRTGQYPGGGGDPEFGKAGNCSDVGRLLFTGHGVNERAEFLDAIALLVAYAENNIQDQYIDTFYDHMN